MKSWTILFKYLFASSMSCLDMHMYVKVFRTKTSFV